MSPESTHTEQNTILLIGNPNVGKTSIFNQLSKKYAITANYPYTTIELNQDIIKIDRKEYELIDTAGIHRIDNPSEEGILSRELIFKSSPKILIQVIEASNIERSMLLTLQLLELEIPMIIVLNMCDELAKKGIRINAKALSEQLLVPVVETVAIEGIGIDDIKKAIKNLKPVSAKISYSFVCNKIYEEIVKDFPENNKLPRLIITLLAHEDPFAITWLEKHYGTKTAQRSKLVYDNYIDRNLVNPSISILNQNNHSINQIISKVVTQKSEFTKFGIQKFGEYSRHPVYGWFIALGIITLTYFLIGKFGASFLVGQMENHIFNPLVLFLDSIIKIQFLNRFLIGDYGLLTTGLFNAVGTVLPIITLFFLVLNFLEDIGYLTNLIILSNRIVNKVGLSGKSILPIVLGFGCKTMATLSTKILDSKKEKYIAIFLIGLAIPCSSQLSINIAALSTQPITSFFIVFATLLFIEIIAGIILNRILPSDKASDFIIEIPPVRIPDINHLLKKTYYRSVWFIKEAVPLFIIGALILFILHETSGIKLLEWLLKPFIVNMLNLPINFSEALVMSLARSEAGAVMIIDMVKAGELNHIQVITAILVVTLFIPCISNVIAIYKELNTKKTVIMVFIITIASFLIGVLINITLQALQYGE